MATDRREVEWEAEVKIRRNGRIFRWERALGDSPGGALYNVVNDLEREYPARSWEHQEVAPDGD